MKKAILFLLLFTAITNISAQQRKFTMHNVTGKVIDADTNQELEYATIVFTPLKKRKITGGITNKNGKFNVRVFPGMYDISIEFISFKTLTIKNQKIDGNLNLGTIKLATDSDVLEEVEIIAEKSTVDIRLDKRIYNVGKDMTVKGGTASDVLDNVPSVTVDVEGNVSLRGNENVRILVNGKPSGLVGLNSTDALRQLPAEAIQKVEVITSPSARYDAEGTAGILNIVLRKGKALGFNSSYNISVGNPDLYGASANLNYRAKKFNIFTNTGYRFGSGPGNANTDITYLNSNGNATSFRNEKRNFDRERTSFNTNVGLEYFINDRSSITGAVIYRNSDSDNTSTNMINNFDLAREITYTNERIQKETDKNELLEYSFNYTNDFNDNGHKLTFDIRHGKTSDNEFAKISDTDFFPTMTINDPERNSTVADIKNTLIQLDYVLPIGENTQFELGYKSELDHLTSNYLVEEFDSNSNSYINNTGFSNELDFSQNIHAVYSQFGNKINKFSYLLGLRMEISDINIKLINTNENFDKNYTQFFPTVNLGYELNDEESFTLGYSRRLRRPRHWFLNPFLSRTSETYIFSGNVDLDPTYTNSFDLGYLKRWDKFTLNSSVYYQHSTNNFEFINEETGDFVNGVPVILRHPINLSSQDRVGFEFTTNYKPVRWWRFSGSFNLFRFKNKGDYSYINSNNETITQNFDAENTSWFARMNSRVTLPGKIEWQTRLMYRGPSETAQSKREGMFSANLAFSKDVLKEKGTLSLNVSDLFNTRKRVSTNYTPRTISEGDFQWRQRQVTLNFTYRFKQKKKRQRSGGEYNGGEGEMEG